MALNRVVLMGRMVRDPELRRTQSGISVTSFTLAVDRDFKGTNGQKETDFIDAVAWRSSAEFVCKYFQKGSLVVVDGKLQIRTWTDKDGSNRRNAEVQVSNVYFGGAKSNGNQQNNQQYYEQNNGEYFGDILADDFDIPDEFK